MKLHELEMLHPHKVERINMLKGQIDYARKMIERKKAHINKLQVQLAEMVSNEIPVCIGERISLQWNDYGYKKAYGVYRGVKYGIDGMLKLEMTKVDEDGNDTGIFFLPYELPGHKKTFVLRRMKKTKNKNFQENISATN